MHDPVALLSFRSSSSIKHKRLLHSHKRTSLRAINLTIFPRSFPIPSFSGSISPQPGRVLPISKAKEVPFLLTHLCFLCNTHKMTTQVSKDQTFTTIYNQETREKLVKKHTRKLPWLALVEINLSNGSSSKVSIKHLLQKVVSDELLIRGMKAKARRQMCIAMVEVIVSFHMERVRERDNKRTKLLFVVKLKPIYLVSSGNGGGRVL